MSKEGQAAKGSLFAKPIIDLSSFPLLSQGAEGRVYDGQFLGRPAIIKQRFSKKYRHSSLDAKLTQLRFKQEVRAILKARKLGILTPAVYFAEPEASTIYMEKLDAKMLKELLVPGGLSSEDLSALLKRVGRAVALLHDGSLVHGDLTTSNILVRNTDHAVAIIDFGLTYNSTIHEDKAVDLYVLERAVTSMATTDADVFEQILAAYKAQSKLWKPILNKFAEVRMRGRKRAMVGLEGPAYGSGGLKCIVTARKRPKDRI